MRRTGFASITLLLVGGTALAQDPVEDSGLVERARRTLVQLDVTVRGPADVVESLTADDFKLELSRRTVRDFTVDRLCDAGTDRASSESSTTEARPTAPERGANYLFYFDQHHLTFGGRARSLEIARDLVERLAPAGRVTIVSSGRTMRTFAPLTSDRAVLLDALDRLEHDKEMWDTFPMEEDRRVAQVQETLELYMDAARMTASVDAAEGLKRRDLDDVERDQLGARVQDSLAKGAIGARAAARGFQREEWWHTERALRRFSSVLARMATYDAPKAVVYFADTMRANAGEHFLGLVGQYGARAPIGDQTTMYRGATTAEATNASVPSFDWIIEEAAAYGVRLYTVQAEGLVARSTANRSSSAGTLRYEGASATAASQRFLDAEGSLSVLALETGGQAFLRGVSAGFIADSIHEDLGCLYLLSFDPGDLPQDRPLKVDVKSRVPGVQTRARAQMVIRSDSSRLTSRLMAAFAAPADLHDDRKMAALVIPTGFDDGKYTALVQVMIPGADLPRVEWDIGISLVSRGEVRQEAAGHVEVRSDGVPIVFETNVTLAPGEWELTTVAHETVSDEIVTGRVEGHWPDPDDERATVGPITLLQPGYAAFLRDGDLRREGSLGRAERDPVRPDLPTALVGIVCRHRAREAVRVERRLVGEDSVEFPAIDLAPGDDRCAVLSDVIPAGVMTDGAFQYELSVRDNGDRLATGLRDFVALGLD